MSKDKRVKDSEAWEGEHFGKPPVHKTGVARFLRPLFIIAVLVVLSTLSVHAGPLRTVTATITKISDGDTVQAITPEGTKLKIRLYGIDAPETPKGNKPGEPFGNASRDYLASLVSQRSV
jgi:micrococcal nuclease